MKAVLCVFSVLVLIAWMSPISVAGQEYAVPSVDRNYIMVEKPFIPLKSVQSVSSASQQQKSSSIEYFDALGRLAQKNGSGWSPAGNDVISIVSYDIYGRQPVQYLPYSFNAGGKFRANPVSEQLSFYQTAPAVVRDSEPYSKIYFDNSPLNNVRKTYGMGWSWHNDAESVSELVTRGTNKLNEVILVQYVEGTFPEIKSNTWVAPNSLSVEETRDESGLINRLYKNYMGQLILKRQGNGSLWHDTYHVYDTQGNVTVIFPPEASARLSEYINATDKAKFLDKWCFMYTYDEFNRRIVKRSPGGPSISMVYDAFDRLVLTQDGNQRSKSQWTFTKYDAFNRPVMTGMVTGSELAMRTSARNSTVHHETRQNNATGYTNASFPSHSLNDLMSITYYDDYLFLGYADWDIEKRLYNFVSESGVIEPSQIFPSVVKGYVTGVKTKVPDKNIWLNSVTYYDLKYNVAQTISENHVGGTDRISTRVHPFFGKPLTIKRVHTSASSSLTTKQELTYDHGQRLMTIHYSINNDPPVLMASHRYNELSQLIEKNLHSTDGGNTWLQSIDSRYNVHGWLTSINNGGLSNDGVMNDDNNDIFGCELAFDQSVSIGSPAVLSPKRFDGSLSAVRWKTDYRDPSRPAEERIYGYRYDPFNRFIQARYATRSGLLWSASSGVFDETINHFDHNGNVGGATSTVGLTRNALVAGSKAEIDKLTYRYDGNKLMHVMEGSSRTLGFRDMTSTPSTVDDYRYDTNGNVIEDFNRLVTRVTYNHMNLPMSIEIKRTDLTPERTEQMNFIYDANGACLTKQILVSGKIVWTTHYVGGIQYDNDRISFIRTPEGRAIQIAPNKYEHEYFLSDFQRNTRAVAGLSKETKRFVATLELQRDTQERVASGFRNIAETRHPLQNMTKPDNAIPTPLYSARCNGYDGKPIGPAKEVKVLAGDVVYMEAMARYNDVSLTPPGSLVPAILAAAVTNTFGVSQTENPTLWQGMTANAPIVSATIPGNTVTPKAYLAFLFFDNKNQFQRSGAKGIDVYAYRTPQKLTRSFTADKDGTLYIYVANETNSDPLLNVYFDDVTVVHQKTQSTLQVFQAADYYPFGLRFNEYSSERLFSVNSPDGIVYQPMIHNRCLFQQQELHSDLDINLYHYQYRMHDPAVGRFWSVDPLTHDYTHNSPYAFSENALTSAVEIEGLEGQFLFRIQKYVSPVAVNISYAKTTHGSNIGFEVSYGIPQWVPFSYRKSFGTTYNSQHFLTKGSFTEQKTGKETTYFGVFNVNERSYKGGGIDQTLGGFTLGNPIVNVEYQNDWQPDGVSSFADPFGIFKPNVGDGGDRWRTAALRFNLPMGSSGFRLGTGNSNINSTSYINGKKTYVGSDVVNPDRFRLGLGYTSFGPFTFGVNSEKIRNQIQNVWTHDSFTPPLPYFMVLPHNDELYLGLYSGAQW